MKADLLGGPLDGGTAEIARSGTKGDILIVSAYCAVAHRFLDHKYKVFGRPKDGKQKFKWKGQSN
jgi:hypothetical protein